MRKKGIKNTYDAGVNGGVKSMFQRRLLVFIGLLLVSMAILLTRLVQLQLFESEVYDREIKKIFEGSPNWLATVRGTISDIKDRPLAVDQPSYRVYLHYDFTRLYDQRFREFMYLEYKVRNSKKKPSEKQVWAYLEKEYGQQQACADKWFSQLALLLEVSESDVAAEIQRVNDRIFKLRAYMARKNWFKENDIPYKGVKSCQEALDDFTSKVKDPYTRLKMIYRNTDPSEIHNYHPIFKSISREKAFRLEEEFLELNMNDVFDVQPIAIMADKQRNYPYGDVACHLIGQMGSAGRVGDIDANINNPTDQDLAAYHPGDRQGAWGVEYMFESHLRGKRGWRKVNHYLGLIDEPIDQQVGSNVTMTIDIELQKSIGKLFDTAGPGGASCTGAAVVIDVPTGEVRAMVSVPTFDLNSYYHKDNYYLINEIDPENPVDPNDPQRINPKPDPLKRNLNRALSLPYQLGSTIKLTHLFGALQRGMIGEHDTKNCDITKKTWEGPPHDSIHNHGPTDARLAIKKSCNMYFVVLGKEIGYELVKDWLIKSGFGRRILIWPSDEFADRSWNAFRETAGHVAPAVGAITKTDKRLLYYGRGVMDGSTLQVANGIATIARDGVYLAPTLIFASPVNLRKVPIPSAHTAHNARIVQKGMKAVIYEPGGTAFVAFDPVPWSQETMLLYGKTGSTDYSHFACFAKAADGRTVAIAVMVEIEEYGGEIAAPLVREILYELAAKGYLPMPDLKFEN